MKGIIHGKRGWVGGRSVGAAEVTAPAVGESSTHTNGRTDRHIRGAAHGIGCKGWGLRLKYSR